MSEIKTIDLGGVTLAYKEFGTGDKYLISTQNFFLTDCHMELLGKPPYDYHTFLVYMRGYGQSTHITDPTPKDYISIWGEDIIRFAEAMNIPSFYYTGVSHGNPAPRTTVLPKPPRTWTTLWATTRPWRRWPGWKTGPPRIPSALPAGLPTTKNIPRS